MKIEEMKQEVNKMKEQFDRYRNDDYALTNQVSAEGMRFLLSYITPSR